MTDQKEPWFKLWSADYLTDSKTDRMSPEAEGLLLRMWCVCNIEGSIPADIEEIARLTRRKVSYVSQCVSQCVSFFELRDGKYFSNRMQREKQKSELARQSAQVRYKKDTSAKTPANRSAERSAKCPAQKARKPEGQNLPTSARDRYV